MVENSSNHTDVDTVQAYTVHDVLQQASVPLSTLHTFLAHAIVVHQQPHTRFASTGGHHHLAIAYDTSAIPASAHHALYVFDHTM